MHPLDSKVIESFSWPDGFTSAAWLCWHVDNEAGVIASGKSNDTSFASFSESRYGVTTALPRILKLCKDFEITASFAFPAYVAESHPFQFPHIVGLAPPPPVGRCRRRLRTLSPRRCRT